MTRGVGDVNPQVKIGQRDVVNDVRDNVLPSPVLNALRPAARYCVKWLTVITAVVYHSGPRCHSNHLIKLTN